MEKKKRNQHYVFRGYLRPWSADEKIYCLREGKIFRPNLEGVACERFFYRVEELTPHESELVDKVIIEGAAEPTKTHLRQFLALYSAAPKLRRQLAPNLDSPLTAGLDELIANFAEDYHQGIEENLLRFIRAMLEGNVEFYDNSKTAGQFLYALCVQYMRTKQMREAMLSQIGTTFDGCDMKRVWGALHHLMAMRIAESLYIDQQKFKVLLVENHTDTPFITGDQPIINLHAGFTGESPEKMEFFYPLAPHKAMMFLEADNNRYGQSPSAISINSLNILMIRNSHEQLFSNSEHFLKSMALMICGEAGHWRVKT